jgi:hypothetical protein
MKKLFVIDRVLTIKERGTIVGGRLIDPNAARFYIGDLVEIRRSGGLMASSTITGIPLGATRVDEVEILLRFDNEREIQPGDEVWVHHRASSTLAVPE